MTHPRALTEQEAISAEQWFTDYERVGTFEDKARTLHVSKDTLRDAIRRVRGLELRRPQKKREVIDIESLANELTTNLVEETTFHEQPSQLDDNDNCEKKTNVM